MSQVKIGGTCPFPQSTVSKIWEDGTDPRPPTIRLYKYTINKYLGKMNIFNTIFLTVLWVKN